MEESWRRKSPRREEEEEVGARGVEGKVPPVPGVEPPKEEWERLLERGRGREGVESKWNEGGCTKREVGEGRSDVEVEGLSGEGRSEAFSGR